MPIQNHPLAIISPLTYLVDLINIGLGLESAFGNFGIIIDFCLLVIFGFSFMMIAFILHEKTLQKRFR
jgi:ABC-type multidrug transport system permease subunit